MYQSVQQCTHCGANLSLDDMRRTDCPYCRTVYPHHSQAQQHAQVIGQVMGQMIDQTAAAQNQWRAAFGAPQIPPYGGAPGAGNQPATPYGVGQYRPDQGGAQQYGQPGMPPPGGFYDPNQMIQAQMAHAHQMSRRIGRQVMISLAFSFVLVIGILVAVFLLR